MPKPDPWPTGQTLKMSVVEAAFSGALATLTSVVLQRVVYPMLGLHVATETTVKLAAFYCFWVFVRQLVTRRVFNRVDWPSPDPINYGLDGEVLEDGADDKPKKVIVGRILTADTIDDPDSAPQMLFIPNRDSPGYDPTCGACSVLGRPCAEHRER